MRSHDVEEFGLIIDRYGFWQDDLIKLSASVATQLSLMGKEIFGEPEHIGKVDTVTGEILGKIGEDL